MATRYDNFAIFMAEVTEETKKRVDNNPWERVINTSVMIIRNGGWEGFLALCVLLVLGPIAFGAAIIPFLATPPGVVIAIVLGAAGGGVTLWTLYKNRGLPLAIKKVGNRYKSRFERIRNNSAAVDMLFDEAVNDLFNELLNC